MSAPRLSNSSRTPISERIKLFGGVDKNRVVPPTRTPLTPDPVSIQRPSLKPTPSQNSGLGVVTNTPNGVGNNGKSQFSAKDPTKGIKKSPGSANSSRSDLSRTPSNASTRSTSTPVSKTASRTGSVGKNSPSPTKKNVNGGSQPSGIKKLPVSRKLSDKLAENNNNNMMASSKLPQIKPTLEMTPPAIEEKTPPRQIEKRVSIAEENTIDTIVLGNNCSAVINFTDRSLEVSEISPPSPVNSSTGSMDFQRDTVDRVSRKTSTDIMFTEQTYSNRKISNVSAKSDISSISSITTNSTNDGLSLTNGGMITVNGKIDSENYFAQQAMNNATSESYSKVNEMKVF